MLTTAYYFLQVILCSAVMMGYYWLVLRNKRFHQYNRFYLLAIALLSWIVPLIKIKWGHAVVNNQDPQMFQFLNVVAYNNTQIEEKIVQKSFQWDWNVFAGSVYFLVAGILLMGMIYALFRIYRLLKTHECKSVGDIYLILTQAKGTPFSFFRYIFWNEEIDLSSESGKQILQHELTHVQEKHSSDKLLMQLILIAGWFNPFFWLIKNELNVIHEFIADRKAVKNGDTASLAQMLLTAVYPQQQFMLSNPFFFSPIKRRLQMLANNANPKFSYMRRLVVLPLLAIVVVLFAFRDKEQKEHTLSVASVVESAVEKGRHLITVQNIPLNTLRKKDTTIAEPNNPSRFTGSELGEFSVVDSMVTLGKIMGKQCVNPPLYLVDGVKVPVMHKIRMNFSSVDIIYDKQTLERYGEEAKNGVVLISTKEFAESKKKTGKTNSFGIGINYQAVARDGAGNLIRNKIITVRPTIIQGDTNGKNLYQEWHQTETNDEGIFSIVIGQGERVRDYKATTISDIDWTKGPFYLNIIIAVPTPVTNGMFTGQPVDMGTLKMMSVPYALYNRDGFGSDEVMKKLESEESPNRSNQIEDPVFIQTQTHPRFPGGEEGWQKYLQRNLNSDLPVEKGAPPGKYVVEVSFIVDKDGNLSDIHAENDPGYGTKQEALRLIEKGPKWVPAEQNGKKSNL